MEYQRDISINTAEIPATCFEIHTVFPPVDTRLQFVGKVLATFLAQPGMKQQATYGPLRLAGYVVYSVWQKGIILSEARHGAA